MTNANNYLATETTQSHTETTSRNLLFIIGLVTALLFAVMVTLVVPQFRNLFQGFGADLPFTTRLAVNYYLGIWMLPILVIAVRLAWPDVHQRSLAALIVGVGGVFASTTALTIVLYLPIFKLGSVV